MKFPVEKCECGLDLATATPTRVKRGAGPNGEPVGGCPNCWRTYYLVEKKKPRGKGGRFVKVKPPKSAPKEES
jgi:hypothetical protein